jgi:glycosyltransferase involved in cell wall biosynthesis
VQVGFYNIGGKKLTRQAPRALIIYYMRSIPYFISDRLDECPFLNSHSMNWETAEMVRLLNEFGYVVDYLDCYNPFPKVNWEKYNLIIDERDNLKKCPVLSGQRKIFYATGCHWLFHNLAELSRISEFYNRNNMYMIPQRQVQAIESDEYCDYLTYLGTDFQVNKFSDKPKKIQLNISAFIPEYRRKNISKARHQYLWIGGGGLIHKGLDLAIEAFCKLPDSKLYVVGNVDMEPKFIQWLKSTTEKNDNIIYCGFLDISSNTFTEIANNCIGVLGPSCSEGGGGAVCQALHFGLIPLVTRSNTVRAENLGYILDGNNTLDIIESIISSIQEIMTLSDQELASKSDAIREFALQFHTRKAYSESFENLLNLII